jgi:uncharacterized membrane protein YhaH (DUF805 family)
MKYYFLAFKRYAVFSGRASRPEFWYFFLFNIIAALIFGFLAGVVGVLLGLDTPTTEGLANLYTLVALLPWLAVNARRLHDTGLSGWWILISLVPLLGLIAMLVLCAQDSQPGPNRFGPNPNDVASPLERTGATATALED